MPVSVEKTLVASWTMSTIDLHILLPRGMMLSNSPPSMLSVDSRWSGRQLRSLLQERLSTASDVRMVCGGRVIQDDFTLVEQGVGNNAKVYISLEASDTRSSTPAKPPSTAGPSIDPMTSTIMKFLATNPELYQQILLSNPQMQKLLERNPELRHALSDPGTLKTILEAASRPAAYNEMLRGQDRVLSNLEMIPEGFSHLKRVYSTMQEPMYSALLDGKRRSNANGSMAPDGGLHGDNGHGNKVTTAPVPNPWAPKQQSRPSLPLGMSADFPFSLSQSSAAASTQASPKSKSQKRRLDSFSLDFSDTGNGDGDGDDSAPEAGAGEAPALDFLELFRRQRIASPIATTAATDYKLHFRAQLESLHELGFQEDEMENIPALLATGGHVPASIERIIAMRVGADDEDEDEDEYDAEEAQDNDQNV